MQNNFITSNNFDLLRLIFAILVFMFHSTVLFGYKTENILFHLPHLAVQGFFIISGFLIIWSFDRNNNIVKYAIKRFFRIYPLYFTLIIIQFILLAFLSTNFSFSNSFNYLISNLVFLNFLSPSIGNVLSHLKVNAINGSLWTLKIEVIFYIFLPFIYYLFKKLGAISLIILYLFSAYYSLLIKNSFLLTLFPAHLRFFIIGTLLYLYSDKIINYLKNKTFISISLLLIFMSANLYINFNIFKSFIYPITLGFAIMLITFCLPYKKLPLDISYGIYVIHFPVIQSLLLFNVFTDNYKLFLLLSGLIIFSLAVLSAIFIEKPCITIGHNLAKNYNFENYNILLQLYRKFHLRNEKERNEII